MTRGEKFQLAGAAIAVMAIFASITWYHLAKVERYDVESNVRYLAATYHLDESQARRLRTLEVEFHGRDKRFGFLVPGDGAGDEHHRAISQLMSPEDASRFLETEAGKVR